MFLGGLLLLRRSPRHTNDTDGTYPKRADHNADHNADHDATNDDFIDRYYLHNVKRCSRSDDPNTRAGKVSLRSDKLQNIFVWKEMLIVNLATRLAWFPDVRHSTSSSPATVAGRLQTQQALLLRKLAL
jgi:hypothetical protein